LRLRHRGLFRTAQLNAIGWTALIGWLAMWAALWGVAASHAHLPVAAGCGLGAATAAATVVIFDRRRWGEMESYFAWTEDTAVVEQAVRRLENQGIDVHFHTTPDGEPSLVYRMRDHRRVMNELGFPAGRRR
jgi:hypothetical protein